jgi:hypothetical protein
MIRLFPVILLLAACGNYGNVYLPQGERKPFSGPNPADFPAEMAAPLGVTGSATVRLNVSPGAASLRATWMSFAGANVVWRVNARKVGETSCGAGECSIASPVPEGTILKGVATLVEIECSAPIIVQRLVIER